MEVPLSHQSVLNANQKVVSSEINIEGGREFGGRGRGGGGSLCSNKFDEGLRVFWCELL